MAKPSRKSSTNSLRAYKLMKEAFDLKPAQSIADAIADLEEHIKDSTMIVVETLEELDTLTELKRAEKWNGRARISCFNGKLRRTAKRRGLNLSKVGS
ncbi:hypothetical protein FEM48_Zijuj02G0016300 [Ziziphus jujuba var. spinosa]|uniref:Uncharacterized protein n=1 Tax=Ziziphus jujuba var. spinosa TaxID=714518 RepID=A0A978VSV5_ZIZJJ|nr:hypothetical protein FEM48_Zijuj02G0016300 [Ziziphus jujuba var. spinosa]